MPVSLKYPTLGKNLGKTKKKNRLFGRGVVPAKTFWCFCFVFPSFFWGFGHLQRSAHFCTLAVRCLHAFKFARTNRLTTAASHRCLKSYWKLGFYIANLPPESWARRALHWKPAGAPVAGHPRHDWISKFQSCTRHRHTDSWYTLASNTRIVGTLDGRFRYFCFRPSPMKNNEQFVGNPHPFFPSSCAQYGVTGLSPGVFGGVCLFFMLRENCSRDVGFIHFKNNVALFGNAFPLVCFVVCV